MKPSIEEVAQRGMEARGSGANQSWAPCPACGAEKRGKHDPRGPVKLTRAASSGPLRGEPAWYCHACGVGGGVESLARALGHDALDGWEVSTPVVPVTRAPRAGGSGGSASGGVGEVAGPVAEAAEPHPELYLDDGAPVVEADPEADRTPLDLAGGWAALAGAPDAWRSRLQAWMRFRGYSKAICDAVEASGEVAVAPAGAGQRRAAPAARRLLRAIRQAPYDVLTALRDPSGAVVDVERRWAPEHRPPDRPKTKRCPGDVVGQNLGTVLFGRLPAAVEAGKRGEPIILVEGSTDFFAATGAAAIRGYGAVLGAPGADDLPKIARALVEALRAANAVPGAVRVYVVPDVGDNLHDPESKGWRIGERRAWAAAVELCEIARPRWCPPASAGKGDLCDLVLGADDPVRAFWDLIGRGQSVLAVGQDVDRWRAASELTLRANAWRLPLHSLLEYLRWYTETDKEGAVVLRRSGQIPFTREGDGQAHLSDVVMHWLEEQGVTFISTDEDLFVWDPIEIARRPPHHPGERPARPRHIPRLIRVGSTRFWDGWLMRIGRINTATPEGRAISRAIRAEAQDAACSALASWLTADGELHAPTMRLHLHTPHEDVLTTRAGRVAVRPNGTDRRVLLASADVETPFEWIRGIAPRDAALLLFRLVGRHLTLDDPERALVLAWLLAVPVRELMKDRPILWATGDSGSGKSFGAGLLNGLFYGVAEAGTFTTAALWEAGRSEPLLCLDNKENAFVDDDLLELFLTASTGTKRRKRGLGGDHGNIGQRFKGMIHLSAISRPVRADLQRRALIVRHDKRFRNEGHRSAVGDRPKPRVFGELGAGSSTVDANRGREDQNGARSAGRSAGGSEPGMSASRFTSRASSSALISAR